MTRPVSLDGVLNLRVTADESDRVDRLAEALTERTLGVSVTRSHAARAALVRGLASFEAELATKKKRTTKGKK